MKLVFNILCLIFITSVVSAQAITPTPTFPTENDSIIITFDATKANNQSLVGYTGALYTHSGVKTTAGDWQHVIGSWGNNNNQPMLQRIGTDLYQLVIGNPREFYNVTSPSEKILQLNFVFRSSDANSQSEDLFQPLFEEQVNVQISSPGSDVSFYDLGEQIEISIVSENSTKSSVYLGNSLIKESTESSFSFSHLPGSFGQQKLLAIAEDNSGNTARDSVYIVVNNEINVADLPQGVIPGINYVDDNTVILCLQAPNKDFVYAIGDFSNWQRMAEFLMNRTSDGEYWWIEINNLTPMEEYRFQYHVDGEILIADPYAEKVLDPWNDKYINNVTYPNLIPYPQGLTEEIVSVFQTAQTEYVWEVENFSAPKKENLVIYELLIRDFVSTHNYQTLIDTLSYFESLGINAIELMPVNEFEGNSSWGYNPSFYFAPDKYYGTKNKLKEFIDECHKRGIAVIMDMVLNHSFGQSPFLRLYSEGKYTNPTAENPWYNESCPHPPNCWGEDFNHESPYTQELIDRINTYWIEEYNIDGYRFDFTKGLTNKGDVGYDTGRINLIKRMGDVIWSIDPNKYIILEHWADNSEETILANYGFMLWGNLVHNFNEGTMGYNEQSKSNLRWANYKARGWQKPHLVTYMESHDEERLMYKNLEYGNSFGNYDIKDLNVALQRIKLAAAFHYTLPGPKMIWQFGELGYDYSINHCPNGTIDEDCRVSEKPIRWDYRNSVTRENLKKTISALIKLKTNNEVFNTTDFTLTDAGALKRIQLNHSDMNVNVIGNFDVNSREINPSFQNTGWWYDYFTGDSIEVTNVGDGISLQAGEFRIYTTEKLPTLEKDIAVGVDEIVSNSEKITDYKLTQNYPNPFNPVTNIKYSVGQIINLSYETQFVTLKVFNTLGQEVATLVNQYQSSGDYEVRFDGSALSSGVYYYRLEAGGNIISKKMLLLK